jgi:predicted metalloenzyme YecM
LVLEALVGLMLLLTPTQAVQTLYLTQSLQQAVVLVEQLAHRLGKMVALVAGEHLGLRLAQEQAVKEMRVALVNHRGLLMEAVVVVQVRLEQMVLTQ